MTIPKSPTFIQTAQRLNNILSEYSSKLAKESLSDGLLNTKSRLRLNEQATKNFQSALKSKADTQIVNKQWREFRKNQIALKKTTDTAKKTADTAKKTGDGLKKVVDNIKSGNWKAVSPFLGKAFLLLGIALTVFSTILGFANTWAINQINESTISQFERNANEFALQFKLIQRLFSRNRLLEQNIQKINRELEANSTAIDVINAYSGETRRYAMTVEAKLQVALQQLSIKTEANLQFIRSNISNIVRQVSVNQQQLWSEIQGLKQRVTNANDRFISSRISGLENKFGAIQGRVSASEVKISAAEKKISALENKTAQPFQSQLLESLRNQVSGLSSSLTSIIKKVDTIEKTLPQKITDTTQKLIPELIDGKLKKLDQDLNVKIDKKLNKEDLITTIQSQADKIFRSVEPYIRAAIEQQTVGLNTGIAVLTSGLQNIASDLSKIKFDVEKLKMPTDLSPLLRRLDQVDAKIALIPALVLAPLGKNLDQLKKQIPTVDQISNASATGTCRTLQPGGCTRKALDDLGNTLRTNQNQNANNLLNAINGAQNAAQLALLNKIDGKLGPQLPGGISNFLTNFFKKFNALAKWMQLDRVLNILIWWQTAHNAAMLSNNIIQTLAQSMDNILAFLNIKDFEGNPISIGEVVGKAYQEMLKSALGEETYNNLNKLWNSANRIYQAATNIVNAIQNMNQAILSALEIIGASVSRIANALKSSGAVLENSLQWMNPSPNFNNKLFTFLERMDQNASSIEQVTQAPLEVRESVEDLKQQRLDILEATKDGENALKGLGIIESENEKNKSLEKKVASGGKDLSDLDLLDAAEVG